MFVFVICVFFPVEWPSVHISWLHYFFREVKQRYWSSNTSPFPLLGKQIKVTQIKDFLNSEGTLFATAIKCWKSAAVTQYWRFLCHLFPQSVGQKWSLKCVNRGKDFWHQRRIYFHPKRICQNCRKMSILPKWCHS